MVKRWTKSLMETCFAVQPKKLSAAPSSTREQRKKHSEYTLTIYMPPKREKDPHNYRSSPGYIKSTTSQE